MRPARGSARECQAVSAVLTTCTPGALVLSGGVSECHGVDVKTVVSRRQLTAGVSKNSQEFTGPISECQGVSARVTTCQRESHEPRVLHVDPLPRRTARDTVRLMEATVALSVLLSAAEAGLGRIRPSCLTVWHGTCNTVPSTAFFRILRGSRGGRGTDVRGLR